MRRSDVFALVCILGLSAGCQTIEQRSESDALSLDAARRTEMELSSAPFVAPPRAPAFLADLPGNLEELGATPPYISHSDLYDDEHMAQLEDAYLSAPALGGWNGWRFRNHARDLYEDGEISAAITLQRYALKHTPDDWDDATHTARLLLAIYTASAGDFETAEALYNSPLGHTDDPSCEIRSQYWQHWARGVIAFAKGRMRDSERGYIDAQARLRALRRIDGQCTRSESGRWHDAKLILGQARAALWQGRPVEAEALALEAGTVYSLRAPAVLIELSHIYLAQGRFDDALRAALGTIDQLNSKAANLDNLLRARALEAASRALIALDRWDEAARLFERLERNLESRRAIWQARFADSSDRGLVLLMQGDARSALPVLEAAYRTSSSRSGADKYPALEARAFVALALEELGREAEALTILREVAPILVARWRESAGRSVTQSARAQRLRLVVETYIALLLRSPAHGNQPQPQGIRESFEIAAALGARSVQRALADGAGRALAKTPQAKMLIEEQRNLERRLASLKYRLGDAASSTSSSYDTVLATLRSEIDRVSEALRKVNAEIERVMPRYAALINPSTIGIDDVKKVLRPGEALLTTFIGHRTSFAWAVGHEGPTLAYEMSVSRAEWQRRVSLVRESLTPRGVTVGDLPVFELEAAHGIYTDLLEPAEAVLRRHSSLVVAVDAPLDYLPLTVLPTKSVALGPEQGTLFANYQQIPWLARTHATTRLPAVVSLLTLRSLPPTSNAKEPFVGFGDPWFSQAQAREAEATAKLPSKPSLRSVADRGALIAMRSAPQTEALQSADLSALPRLPETADEIRDIAAALGASPATSVFLGPLANEAEVKKQKLSRHRVLAFATHGLVPGALDGLQQPALALSSPEVSKIEGDGLLTMTEIFGLGLDADWVILSACDTGAGEGAGAEAVSGLGRAFFYAGARALLVSNWPVETTSAKAITTDLFRRQSNSGQHNRARALQQTMLSLIDGAGRTDSAGHTVFSYAHPLFWAPFSLIGDGGGAPP